MNSDDVREFRPTRFLRRTFYFSYDSVKQAGFHKHGSQHKFTRFLLDKCHRSRGYIYRNYLKVRQCNPLPSLWNNLRVIICKLLWCTVIYLFVKSLFLYYDTKKIPQIIIYKTMYSTSIVYSTHSYYTHIIPKSSPVTSNIYTTVLNFY